MGSNAFAPNPLTVAVGTTVTWVNNDTVTHDATARTHEVQSRNIADDPCGPCGSPSALGEDGSNRMESWNAPVGSSARQRSHLRSNFRGFLSA